MNKLRGERGYTLFLTVLILVVFSVISVSLITITISGAKRSEVREDITQAGELAEKGLKHLMQEINHELQKELDQQSDGLTVSDYTSLVDQIIDDYIDRENMVISNETGTYDVSIIENLDRHTNSLPKRVKVKSIGKTEDKEKELIATVSFGGDVTPDYMQYAVSSYISDECIGDENECLPGEGNLYLHGGVSIQGDINIERNLVTSNRSYEKYASHHWIHSYFPSVKKKEDKTDSKLIIGGNLYTITWDTKKTRINNFDYNNHIDRLNFPNEEPYEIKEVIDENIFVGDYIPQKSERTDHPARKNIAIQDEKDKYKYDRDDKNVKIIETNLFGTGGVDRVIKDEDYSEDKVFPKWYKNFSGNFHIRGHSTFKQFATDGNVTLGNIILSNIIEFKEGAYIDGNLTVGNNVHLKGPQGIYVNGDLEIKGRNLTLDTVFYVNGDVHIKHATGDSTITSNIKGDHIIYADGKIVVERVNRFNDYPNTFHAYYYSNKSIEIDGNESNIIFKGGLSAPRIVLNGIRGRSYAGANLFKQSKPQIVEARAYEGYKEQAKRESRLQIIYNDRVIKKYSDLLLESRIYQVPPASIIDYK